MSKNETADAVLQRVLDHVGDVDPTQEALNDDDFSEPEERTEWNIAGIAGPTRLSTDFGEVPAHLVRVRDKIRSRDGRYLPVIRISEYKLEQAFLDRHPDAQPVVIRPHSLGNQSPVNTIQLSPAQRVVMPTDWSKKNFVRADSLSSMRASHDVSTGMVSYYSFDVGEPTVLQCEGLWVESQAH